MTTEYEKQLEAHIEKLEEKEKSIVRDFHKIKKHLLRSVEELPDLKDVNYFSRSQYIHIDDVFDEIELEDEEANEALKKLKERNKTISSNVPSITGAPQMKIEKEEIKPSRKFLKGTWRSIIK